MSFGIAFEGCAGKAAFHVGVVEWMAEQRIAPVAVSGASSGAIIAAAVACGLAGSLRETWMGVSGQPVFQPRRMLNARWPFAMSDIVGGAVQAALGGRNLSEVEIPVAIPVTILSRRGLVRRTLTPYDDVCLARAIMASCFLPGPYSEMVPIDGHLALDGAWQVRTPVADLWGFGVGRTIACVTNCAAKLIGGFFKPVMLPVPEQCRILAPVSPLPVGSFDLHEGRMLESIEIGRHSAESFFQANEKWLLE